MWMLVVSAYCGARLRPTNHADPLTLLHQHPSDGRREIEAATACGAAFCTDEGGIPILVVVYADSRALWASLLNIV